MYEYKVDQGEENYQDFRENEKFKLIKNVSVMCLQSINDLKRMCEKLGLKFEYAKNVDLILDDRFIKGQKFYFIKWQGYSSEHNSWKSADQLIEYKDMICYYDSLKYPPSSLTEEMIFYFIKDICVRKPHDYLTLTKLCALIYATDAKCIYNLKLSFADLRKKAINVLEMPLKKLNKLRDELLIIMQFAELRKIMLSNLKDWEIKMNAISSVYVKVENDVDLDGPPANFICIDNYISFSINLAENPIVFCSCENCFENSNNCCSHNLDGTFAYNEKKLLQLPPGYPIYECNNLCKCDENCINRVVQHGPKVNVAIFRTSNGCGWGLKTLDFIEKGQFVLEYLGEIITSELAEQRGEVYNYLGRTYLFDLDYDKDCVYTVDSMLYGNSSRFINHSCDPNLEIYTLWFNLCDPKLPRLAFFAKRKIKAGEELTFDYKMMDTRSKKGETVPDKDRIICNCGSKNCRKYLF
ncbi:histone-lysine N-methyltransferase SUV39H2 [Caerostris darwini]|uniref:Histone-lysine N-methyltransferase n=1 Tax=Caerostris darwini TaxID=1538125 RepID=A0AAV4UU35_9ARAC|nr:histone-lysine N-methyltransferase SUV39H2 [Caerostris darwini]